MGGGEQQAMSAERLAEIREELRAAIDDSVLTHTGRSIGDVASQRVIDDIWPLIEAREAALVARIAQAMAIVRDVANECTVAMWPAVNGGNDDHEPWCAACLCIQTNDGNDSIHDDDCPVMQARALLASDGESEQATQAPATPDLDENVFGDEAEDDEPFWQLADARAGE